MTVILPHEREYPQPLEVDLTVWLPAGRGAVLDYRALHDAARAAVVQSRREYLEEIIRVERELSLSKGFAILPTVGGQTALNLAVELSDGGILDKYNVQLIGANIAAIKKAEDRLYFKDAMQKIGLDVPKSALVNNLKDGLEFAGKIGFPVIVRPSFTLGGRRRAVRPTQRTC